MRLLNKQSLRSKISRGASFTEIYLTALILVGVLIFSAKIVQELYEIVQGFPDFPMSIDVFLADVLALVIAIEFVKMLAKHTPGSAIDVVLFATARKLILNHEAMMDSLVGVVAIAILFIIRKYLADTVVYDGVNGTVINSDMGIHDFNKLFNTKVGRAEGHTVGGLVQNIATRNKEEVVCGYCVEVEGHEMEVYSMEEALIKQVKVYGVRKGESRSVLDKIGKKMKKRRNS